MMTVLGPTAVNEKKFTAWQSCGKALGLLWNTVQGNVSIPKEKMTKVRSRIQALLAQTKVIKSDLNKLLGVLRHVAACFPAARAFYQQICSAAVAMLPYGGRLLSGDVINDLYWFRVILDNDDHFNGIPVERFAQISVPVIHVYMDASDTGLCALEPARREFIRIAFTASERVVIQDASFANSVNVRELQSAVLAALHWGPI
ncbi:hypothetical protein BBJ28_00005285 [Nothophytophthora sp. Chile5]|nr:hypothetical protein BBJ28_00005285 [Nothophytophthora sp. Chile5]